MQTRAADAAEKLRRQLGDEAVITEEGRLEELGGDKWFAHRRPDLAAFPKNSAEVAMVMKVASDYQLPVTTRGAGYGYVGRLRSGKRRRCAGDERNESH